MKLDFGSGYNAANGYKTCDCTGNPMLDYHFDPESYTILDTPNDVFDVIRIRNVLHHIQDIKKLFKELYRVLKPGGSLIIIEPNQVAYPINVFLDTLWYRGIIPRAEIWFSPIYRDYKKELTDAQMCIKLWFEIGEKEIFLARKN